MCATQVQLDDLFALRSAVKDGEGSEAGGDQAPLTVISLGVDGYGLESKALWVIDMGDRLLAIAQMV